MAEGWTRKVIAARLDLKPIRGKTDEANTLLRAATALDRLRWSAR